MLTVRRNGSVPALLTGPAHQLSPAFDRFFDDFFAPLSNSVGGTSPMALWQDENNVYLEMDVPGLAEEDIDLTVHGEELTISGERKQQERQGGYDTRRYGRFEQRLTLPVPVDQTKIEARLTKGVLSLTLPKSEAAKPFKIAFKSE